MPQIGSFTRDKTGFAGCIQTFLGSHEIVIVPAEKSDSDNAPDYRIHRDEEDGPEIGAGWKRTGERAGDYVVLLIDDPLLPQPLRANLFRDGSDGGLWSLHWSRPPKRDGRD
ncbi:protein of unknown function DUF736 [Zymomonas mobilis subsp. mobilis NCIMB 11163]|uniref:DUF736 domain-containing protein n=1 Tax=Zymomonas mobilis TaxID=542 RepID=UPI0001B7061F|nr:DUF736 domain-containing protein [Zymomonas mobilis]ACV75831.1 protein of unknown function DUF736 [Zymomonas mobilis subsp. mobilis NCIMB 11163]